MLTDKEQEEIRRKMLALEEEPALESWSKISAQIRPARKRRPWGWFFLAALLLLVVPGGVYYMIHKTPETQFTQTGFKNQPKAKADAEASELSTRQAPLASTPTSPDKKLAKRNPEGVTDASHGSTIHTDEPTNPSRMKTSGRGRIPRVHTKTGRSKVPVLVSRRDSVLQDKQNRERNLDHKSIAVETVEVAPITVAAQDTVAKQNLAEAMADSIAEETPVVKIDSLATDSTKAEEVEKEKKKASKPWYLGVTFAPRYAFRKFKPVDDDEVFITQMTSRKGMDMERMGYEFALNYGKQLKNNLYLETSLSLMQLRENVGYSYTTGAVDSVTQTLAPDGSILYTPYYTIGERQLKSSYAYGGLRVGVSYFFRERPRSRFNLTLAGGMNLLVRGRTREYLDGVWTETIIFPSKNNILEQSNYNILIGGGYNVRVHHRFELMLMPSLNYFLGSTFKKREPFGLQPYSVGFTIQVRRHSALE